MRVFFIILLTLLAFSCKKKGCVETAAINYNSEAEKDDGSCEFSGTAILWFNSVTATNMVNSSIPNIDLYINGVSIGSCSATQYSLNAPPCVTTEGLTGVASLGNEKAKVYTYQVKKSGTSTVLQTGNIELFASNCSWINFTY